MFTANGELALASELIENDFAENVLHLNMLYRQEMDGNLFEDQVVMVLFNPNN